MKMPRSAVRALESIGGVGDGDVVHLSRTDMHLVARMSRAVEVMTDADPELGQEPSDFFTWDLGVHLSRTEDEARSGRHLWHFSQRAQAHLPLGRPRPDRGYPTRRGITRDLKRVTVPWLLSTSSPLDIIDQLAHRRVVPAATYGWTAERAVRDRLRLARAFALPGAFDDAARDAAALVAEARHEGDQESIEELQRVLREEGVAGTARPLGRRPRLE